MARFRSTISVFVLAIAACTTPENSTDLTYFIMIGDAQGLSGGTDTLTTLHLHTDRDSMVGAIEFSYGTDHVVRAWTDDHYSPVDGGSFWLELDSMGEVFGCSTTWPGFSVVRSNNDSINELITMAIAAASRFEPHGIRYPDPPLSVKTVQFSAVEDTLSP